MDPLDPAGSDDEQVNCDGPPTAPIDDAGQADADAGGEAQMLCPHCLAPNEPLADFCYVCGAPITSLATMDPYKRIFVEGWAYRRAVSNPTKPIIVWGMLLIFGPTLLGLSWTLVQSWPQRPYAFVMSGVLVLYGAICWRVIARYRYLRHLVPGHCTECGYDLRGLPEPRCPECGTPFDPDDVDAEDEEPPLPAERDA